MVTPAYTQDEFTRALRAVGLTDGSTVFSHGNIGFFGVPTGTRNGEEACALLLQGIFEVIGPRGTLIVPTFTYSFCRRQPFDVAQSPSTCGVFSEFVRRQPGARRSGDPIFSVVALGARAEELTADAPVECFGNNSFWQRFLEANGMICNFNLDAGSTFIHYVEKCLKVSYRFDKLFPGVFQENGGSRRGAAIFFCHDLSNPNTAAVFEPFHKLATEENLARTANVGRGQIVAISASATFSLIERTLPKRPFFLTAADATGSIKPVASKNKIAPVPLPTHASMKEMIGALWRLPRDIVSDGYDAALEAFATQVPMEIHQYPTGTNAWTWLVPEKWTCHEAFLETTDGERLFSYADNPLHVVSYSLPFDGIVSREELFHHLHTHRKLPHAVPFVFKYYERDWGLCCSQNLKDSLTKEKYRVVIRSEFSFGALKVGDAVAPGRSEQTIVLCAHLCHPAQANDDLSGVVVGLEVMRALQQKKNLRHTYRLLLLPETIGSITFLSQNEALIPHLKGGLFIEMTGLPNPAALQYSFDGKTEIDQCFALALREQEPDGWTGAFRTIIGNDERQFNSPGVRVPMLSLSRVLRPDQPDWPYLQYHSSDDNPAAASEKHLQKSVDLILAMIDVLEKNQTPVNLFQGEVFCSRYGLHIDFATDPASNRALFDIMYLIDGNLSLADLATKLNVPFSTVHRVVEELHRCGLVRFQ